MDSSSSSEPPPKPERNISAVEPWTPAKPIKSSIISSTSESDQEASPEKTEEAEEPVNASDEVPQEEVNTGNDIGEETQAPPATPGKIMKKGRIIYSATSGLIQTFTREWESKGRYFSP